jgi:predicted RNA polymerase sigma factor
VSPLLFCCAIGAAEAYDPWAPCEDPSPAVCLARAIAHAKEEGNRKALELLQSLPTARQQVLPSTTEEQEAAKARARAQQLGLKEIPVGCAGRMTRDGCQPR